MSTPTPRLLTRTTQVTHFATTIREVYTYAPSQPPRVVITTTGETVADAELPSRPGLAKAASNVIPLRKAV